MAGCNAQKVAECKRKGEGWKCSKGRCVRTAEYKRLQAKGGARKQRPSTSLVVGAVMANVGSPTAASLVSKRRSSKLGAGMSTMVAMTRDEVSRKRRRSGQEGARKRRRVSPSPGDVFNGLPINWSAPGVPGSRRKGGRKSRGRRTKTGPTSKGKVTEFTKRGGGGSGNRMVNWSQDGLPALRMTAGRMTASGECVPCQNPRRPIQDKATCKCYAEGSDAARRAGICLPRTGTRNGRPYTYETVPVPNKRGGISCVKAGGSKAKATLGGVKACPEGKVLKKYRTRVPTGDGMMRAVEATRCVKAVGAMKDCPTNQVVALVPHPREGDQRRCVLPATASKKGYRVLKAGTLPERVYSVRRPAMSPGM